MISSRLTNTRRDPNMLAKIRTPGKGDNCFIVQPLTYGNQAAHGQHQCAEHHTGGPAQLVFLVKLKGEPQRGYGKRLQCRSAIAALRRGGDAQILVALEGLPIATGFGRSSRTHLPGAYR